MAHRHVVLQFIKTRYLDKEIFTLRWFREQLNITVQNAGDK